MQKPVSFLIHFSKQPVLGSSRQNRRGLILGLARKKESRYGNCQNIEVSKRHLAFISTAVNTSLVRFHACATPSDLNIFWEKHRKIISVSFLVCGFSACKSDFSRSVHIRNMEKRFPSQGHSTCWFSAMYTHNNASGHSVNLQTFVAIIFENICRGERIRQT